MRLGDLLPQDALRLPEINWEEHLGQKANLVEGVPTLDPQGFLTISKNIAPYNLLIQGGAPPIPICPKNDFRGRNYRFMRADCVTLVAEWYDKNINTNILVNLKGLFGRTYQNLNFNGYEHIVENFGFVQKQTSVTEHGDLVFYENPRHIGVCLNSSSILHHLPNKYSCVDTLNQQKILKVYRYAN
jgi:hypothetical protein